MGCSLVMLGLGGTIVNVCRIIIPKKKNIGEFRAIFIMQLACNKWLSWLCYERVVVISTRCSTPKMAVIFTNMLLRNMSLDRTMNFLYASSNSVNQWTLPWSQMLLAYPVVILVRPADTNDVSLQICGLAEQNTHLLMLPDNLLLFGWLIHRIIGKVSVRIQHVIC